MTGRASGNGPDSGRTGWLGRPVKISALPAAAMANSADGGVADGAPYGLKTDRPKTVWADLVLAVIRLGPGRQLPAARRQQQRHTARTQGCMVHQSLLPASGGCVLASLCGWLAGVTDGCVTGRLHVRPCERREGLMWRPADAPEGSASRPGRAGGGTRRAGRTRERA